MKNYFRLSLLLATVLLALAGCEPENPFTGNGTEPEGPSYIPKDNVFLTRGLKSEETGNKYASFTYTGYAPLQNKPVHVLYYIPKEGDVTTMPVLFCFTGAERTGETQLDAWKAFSDAYEIILINPQFPKTNSNPRGNWSENEYQFGGLTASKSSETIRDSELWTYNIVESLFDYFLKEVDGTQTGYRMFGHSAGGQFVGRMVFAMPDARIIKAVAANPSSWAWPEVLETEDKTESYGWPYSVRDLPVAKDKATLEKVFAKRLYVQAGMEDTGTESLDMSAAGYLQGHRRYDRALNFHQACLDKAAAEGVSCNFSFAPVAGVGHSTWHMVYGYYKPTASRVEKDRLGEYAAYLLLFD